MKNKKLQIHTGTNILNYPQYKIGMKKDNLNIGDVLYSDFFGLVEIIAFNKKGIKVLTYLGETKTLYVE